MTRRGKVTLLVSTGVFMASLDLFIVNIAFPSIEADFAGSSLSSVSWVLNAYAIVFAAALVPAGRWFDRHGRKLGFLLGTAIFGLGSLICAVAPSLEVLVGARVIQALGAAMLVPTSLGLLLPEYPPDKRANAVALWAAVGGVAAAAGPPIGGLLVELSWRWVFIVNLPIVVATLIVGRTLLNEIRDPEPGPRPHLFGAFLLFATIALLTWAIVEAPDHGWTGPRTLVGLAASVIIFGVFVALSRRHHAPVVPAEIVARPVFVWASIASALFYVAFASMLLEGVLILTTLWGYSTVAAGFALAPGPALAATFASRGGPLVQRFGPRPMAISGMLIFALGTLFWWSRLAATPDYVGAMLPGLALSGIGVGLVLPSTANAAFGSLPPALLSTGIAVFNVARQVGSALGVALLIAVLSSPTPAELPGALVNGFVLMGGACLLAAGAAVMIGPRPVPVPVAAPAAAGDPAGGLAAGGRPQTALQQLDESLSRSSTLAAVTPEVRA